MRTDTAADQQIFRRSADQMVRPLSTLTNLSSSTTRRYQIYFKRSFTHLALSSSVLLTPHSFLSISLTLFFSFSISFVYIFSLHLILSSCSVVY
ncbi:hypothetical protein O181_055945 [Austropuccinia psidii MF-1]|uniref:Transmembrane protein n=1 Tax=Austropuccinia psidii MF-1 TaxID=1389203 RepID=A0A9Q3EBS9_9BASI|nr:hypothetical protein [Austropuccinia psidii MF-1]